MGHEVAWFLIVRYAVLAALCTLIPLPIVDGWAENMMRRRLIRRIGERHGVSFVPADLSMLADSGAGGCLGCIWSVVSWPLKKLLRYVLWVLAVKVMVDTATEIVHRAMMVEIAVQERWLPGDAVGVRAAMNRATSRIDTDITLRVVTGSLETSRKQVRALYRQLRPLVREGAAAERGEERGTRAPVEDPTMDATSTAWTQQLADRLAAAVVVEDVFAAFKEELGLIEREE
jgi:hypothetical protein